RTPPGPSLRRTTGRRESDRGCRDDEDLRTVLAAEWRSRKAAGEEGRADRSSPGMGRPNAGRDGRSDEVLEGEQEMSQKITSYPGHEITSDELKEVKYLDVYYKIVPRYSWAAGDASSRYLDEQKNGRIVARNCHRSKRIIVAPTLNS